MEQDHWVEDLAQGEALADVAEELIVEFPEADMADPGSAELSTCAAGASEEAAEDLDLDETLSETIRASEDVDLPGLETGKYQKFV